MSPARRRGGFARLVQRGRLLDVISAVSERAPTPSRNAVGTAFCHQDLTL